ncbi:MAG: TrfB-related DNA-binding protein [Legionellales bacterium]
MATVFRRLTDDEFNQAMNNLRVNNTNMEAARLAMVDGWAIRVAAQKIGVSENMLTATVKRIWNKHIEISPLPDGWDRAIIELPKDELKSLQKKSTELKHIALKEQAIKSK